MKKPNIQIWDVAQLVPYEQNVKVHDKKQVAVIAGSIKEFGWHGAIMVDKVGSIIAGHGRRLALQSLGIDKVPVWVRDDLTAEQVRALRLVDNKAAEGGIDTEMFRRELADLEFDMGAFFSEKELDFAIADLGTINMSAFVDDVAAAVDAQDAQTKETTAAVSAKPVPIAKLLGFKDVSGKNQLAVSRLMAEIEHRTALKGEDALVAFHTQLMKVSQ